MVVWVRVGHHITGVPRVDSFLLCVCVCVCVCVCEWVGEWVSEWVSEFEIEMNLEPSWNVYKFKTTLVPNPFCKMPLTQIRACRWSAYWGNVSEICVCVCVCPRRICFMRENNYMGKSECVLFRYIELKKQTRPKYTSLGCFVCPNDLTSWVYCSVL